MLPFRVIRSGVLLAGLLATLGTPLLAAGGGFTASLSAEEKSASGLTTLTADELAALDRLVAEQAARPGSFAGRQPEARRKEAGLDRLTPAQLAKLDDLVATAAALRPQPKERPRLKDNEVVSLKRRLQMHGGMAFTYGTGGGGSFREVAAWVSYYDPVTGLGLGFGFSRFSGDGFYGYYPDYYDRSSSYIHAAPRATFTTDDRLGAARESFAGDGASLHGPGGWARPAGGFRR